MLGPIEVTIGGRPLPLTAAKQKTVLALLLLNRGQVVSLDRLVDALWAEEPPATATTALHGYVSQLRRLLGADSSLLVTRPPGYVLEADAAQVDLAQFEQLALAGREAIAEGSAARAGALLREALDLWRGAPLAELAYDAWAQGEIARLEELRLAALEDRVDADLAVGRHGDLVAELERLIGEHPLRERFRAQLMLALYRQGRQADALDCYQQTRELLDEQLGIEPSPELRELHRLILNHDASLVLDAQPRAARPSLPTPLTAFLGRERELADVTAMLGRPELRLLTLTGPGGTGKTRLALQAATELAPAYEDGVFWISLASIRQPELVLPTAAQALETTQELSEHIGARHTLLVLDNFEQVVEAAPELAALLAACPRLELLVTSREALRLSGEHTYPVPPLDRDDGVELFLTRARAHEPAFEANGHIAELCARLDNLPLAIELAAARTTLFSPEQLIARLTNRLDLLKAGRDADPRQQTLRATIDWSHDLLDEDAQQLFRRLAVFAGGGTFEAAAEVAGADPDTLQSLIEKSLVRHSNERYWMLETIREYANEQLARSDELERLHRAHAEWCLAAVEDDDFEESVRRVWSELHNLRQATAWSAQHGGDLALKLALALAKALSVRGSLDEARVCLERALGTAEGSPPELRAEALHEAAGIAMRQGDMDAVHALAEDALLLARERGDTPAVVRALTKLTNVAVSRGNVDEAVAIAEQAIEAAEQADDPRSAVNGLNALGLVELARGRPVAAREAFERALVMVAEQDRRPDTVATLKYNVALASVLAGQPEAAEALLEEAIATYRALGDAEGVAYCFVASAAIHAGRDEPSRAGELLYAAELLLAEVAASLEPAEQELFASTLARVESELGPDELSGARERAWELANAELTLMTGEGLTRPRPVASARLPAPKGG